MALNLSGTSGITGAGIGTIGPSGANITGVGTFTQVEIDDKIIHTGDTNTAIRFPSADTITAETGGSERLRITSGGLIGFGGQTSPASVVHIQDLTDDGYELKMNGNSVQFNRTSLSYIDQLNDTGSIVFRTTSSYTERMRIESGGDIKVASGDLYFGTAAKGIVLGATSNTDANTLDDYEEGTFTPELTNGYNSITYNNQYGFYTKIGRFVSYSIYLYVQGASGDNSEIRINLPFTTANTTGMEEGGSIVYQLNFLSTSDDSKTNSYVFTGKNMSYLRLIKNNNGAAIFGNDTTLGTGGNNVYLLIKGFLTTTA